MQNKIDTPSSSTKTWVAYAVIPKIKRGMKRRPNKRKKEAAKLKKGIWQ